MTAHCPECGTPKRWRMIETMRSKRKLGKLVLARVYVRIDYCPRCDGEKGLNEKIMEAQKI